MKAFVFNTLKFPASNITGVKSNSTLYNNGYAYPVSVISPIHGYPVRAKSILAHDRCPQQCKRRSTASLQAQIDNALTELNESEEDFIIERLQELADSLVLPPNYLAQLPNDLLSDLKDAAFDLASGPVTQECGQKFGEMFMQLSQAWEKADTQSTAEIANLLPSLQGFLTENVNSAVGKRLIRAGRRFASMGQYGQGELQKIAKSMIAAGEVLAKNSSGAEELQQPMDQTQTLKFGTLQVELSSKKAYIGTVIALVFGILSWQLSAAVQSIPEGSLQYANDNALILAKSLRGSLLALCYSPTVLSGFTVVGLFLLGRELSSEGK